MNWIDLGNPVPKQVVDVCHVVKWPVGARTKFPAVDVEDTKTLNVVMGNRRTRYELQRAPLKDLGALLGLVSSVQRTGGEELGFPISYRPCPSAGAIHPIHIVVNRPDNGWQYYDPLDHCLIDLATGVLVSDVRKSVSEVVAQSGDATLLLFAAEPDRTFAKYNNACSLVWRDAGVLLGYLSIAAESLGLNFVPLGISGEPFVSSLVDEAGLVGVGGAFVGRGS